MPADVATVTTLPQQGLRRATLRRLGRERAAIAGAAVLVVLLLACVAGEPPLPPGAIHDLVASTLVAGRLSLSLAAAAGMLGFGLCLAHGALVARNGTAERLRYLLVPVPLAALLAALPSAWPDGNIAVTLAAAGIPGWLYTLRESGLAARRLRGRAFVDAGRLAGLAPGALVRRHVLPNLLPAAVGCSILTGAATLLVECVLTATDAGMQAPAMTWGTLVRSGLAGFETVPSNLLIPLAVLAVASSSLVLLGRGLRNALEAPLR